MKKTLPLFAILSVLFASPVLAGNDSSPIGARSSAMGGTSLVFTDIFSAFNNQAGLAHIDGIAIGLFSERRFLVEGVNLHAGAVAFGTNSGTFGLSVNYFGFSNYNEKKIGLAYARKFGDNVSAGIQFDYLQTAISEYGTRNSFTFEAGILFNVIPELQFAAHVFNPVRMALSEDGQDKLPTVMNFGAAYTFSEKVMVAAEVEKDLDHEMIFKAGLEYQIVEMLELRAGVSTNPTLVSFGAGLNFKTLDIDIAGSYHQVLGFTPGVSVAYIFDKKKKE